MKNRGLKFNVRVILLLVHMYDVLFTHHTLTHTDRETQQTETSR